MTQVPINLHTIAALQRVAVREGVELTPLVADDAAPLLEIITRDPSIGSRVTFAALVIDEKAFYEQLAIIAEDPELIRYGIRENGRLVGVISFWKDPGFFGQTPEPDGYGFGFFLDKTARGRGLISQSVEALMSRAKQVLPVGVFIAFCEDDNEASKAVLSRTGFTPTDEMYGEPTHGWQERKYLARV